MSNKTQLQTNNTALASLTDRVLAAKDTAAALPDAGSGGASVEYGSVKLSSVSNTIRVDNLGFTPSQVFFRLGDHAGGSIGISSSQTRILIAATFGNIDNRELYASSTPGYGSKPIGTYYSAEIIENGFVINGKSSGYIIPNGYYDYIAIG